MQNRSYLVAILLFSAVFCANSQPYTINTVAGTARLLDGHNANTVPLRQPVSVAIDKSGNLYIADDADNRIRKVDTSGIISTFAGTGLFGYNGDRIQATSADLFAPTSIAFDASGNLYVADSLNFRVRMISPDGTINTVAGNGLPGFRGDGGPASQAQIEPVAITLDNQGNLYISTGDSRIRKVDSTGTITTICGTGTSAYSGDNGPANLAAISQVTAMATDAKGNLYLADYYNGFVRMIDATGTIHPFAGSGIEGLPFDGIPASQALLVPNGLAFDSSGANLYISDADLIFTEIRVVNLSTGIIQEVAGNGNVGFLGDNGAATKAEFYVPAGLAVTSTGTIYVADILNFRVRKIANGLITTVAGTNDGDGGPATSAFLNLPSGVAVDSNNNVVVADTSDLAARRFMLGGNIDTFGQAYAPLAVAVDSAGDFYVSDSEPVVVKITPAGVSSVIAGNAQSGAGYSGDGGQATSALIDAPLGVAVDASNNVFIADFMNNRIRKVTAATGIISTIAGSGNPQFSGDSGPALNAGMTPADIALDKQGNLYVADEDNNRVRKITTDGNITTVAGSGVSGYSGDGGPATAAQLFLPTGVAVDTQGNLYIADFGNSAVRRVNPQGLITTIAGTGIPAPNTGDGGPAIAAQLNPYHLFVDGSDNVFVVDSLNDRVRELTPVAVTVASISVVSGDKQSATVGTALGSAVVVKVADSNDNGIPGVVVNFSVSPAGAATVSPSPAITLNDGTVSAAVTLGNTPGPVMVMVSTTGASSVSFSATATPAVSPTAPVISAAGIVSAGLSAPPITTVAANGIATIFGIRFAPPGTAHQVGQQDLVNGKIPTNLAGACAVFGTHLAPILGVYPTQLNVQVPNLPPGDVSVQVITQCGTSSSQTSNSETVTVQAAAPEFFYFVHNTNGPNPIAAIDAVKHGSIGAPGLAAGGPFTPAQPGELLTLFGTGFGATNPPFGSGVLPGKAAQVTAPVSITFGGIQLAASDILYVGVTQNAGLYQVNLRVPANVADGDQPVVITIGGVASPSGGFITVQSSGTSAISHP